MNKILLDGQKRQNKPGHEKKEKFTNIAFYAQNMAQFLFLSHDGEIGTRLVELREFPTGLRSSIFRQSRGDILMHFLISPK